MYTLTTITDNRNHEFLLGFLRRNCRQTVIQEMPLRSVIGSSLNGNLIDRIRKARMIKRWLTENRDNFDGVLIFSDYNFAYRTLIHYCRSINKPIFIYQDGFIIFEPWPKNISGLLKRIVFRTFTFLGFGHLVSYQSFHTRPNAVFSWGDFFSKTFRKITPSEVLNIGTIMHDKHFNISNEKGPASNSILYFGTYYREFEKNQQARKKAVGCLKSILATNEDLTCDIKPHPLDKDRSYINALLQENSLDKRTSFLGSEFLLHESIDKYRFIVSEFSTETLFASMFSKKIFFIKNDLNEKHFKLLNDFIRIENIGEREFYKIDQSLIAAFQSNFFQKINIELFEQAIQKYH